MGTDRFHAAIERLCGSGLDEHALVRALARHLREAVPCVGLLVLRTDPTTVLPTGGVVEALPPALCMHFWDNELLEDDVNKFVDLSRAAVPAAILSETTGGDLARSRRFATLYRDLGLSDELRVSFTARDGSCWAIAQLVRDGGERFAGDERDLLATAAPAVADALRSALTVHRPARVELDGPAVVVLDDRGHVGAVTPEARHWLGELRAGDATGMAPVPEAVYAVAGRARAAAAGAGEEPASAQVRTSAGVWLTLHATCLEGPEPRAGDVAVVISPSRAPDFAPLIALAYRLTSREQEVLEYLARGMTTAEMAQHLGISPHTVRDHVKALLAKVGVRSRGELVARVFADHYFRRLASGAATSR